MLERKICKKITILFLVVVFVFAPLKFPSQRQFQQKAIASISPTIDADITLVSGEYLVDRWVTIKNGATLTIEKGTTIKFAGNEEKSVGINVRDGAIVAKGTESEKIIFTKANEESRYGMYLSDRSGVKSSFFRYVEFFGGGFIEYPTAFNTNKYLQKALAYGFLEPTITYNNGKVHIENSIFKDSIHKDIVIQKNIETENDTNYLEIANSNFEGGQDKTAIKSGVYCYLDDGCPDMDERVKLVNNWYDSELGPKQAPNYVYGGKRVEGDYKLPNWRSKELIADPVVVIPGIMGSATEYAGGIGKLKMDPILHTYDNMLLSFEENGYEKNANLFEFPYEWRNSNVQTAGLLKEKIQEIKNQTGVSMVDIAAHSMGGLVSRYYIESPLYGEDVDQLITMGTPQKGSPKSYPKWEAGEGFLAVDEKFAKFIFTMEAHTLGDCSLFEYIRSNVKSAQELLPNYDYLKDVDTENMRDIPGNIFLDFLNNADNILKLDPVRFVAIVGDVQDEKNTIAGFRVIDSEKPGIWEHGMPKDYYDNETDRGMEKGHGDETVPLESATGITADEIKTYDSTHGELPTKSQCYVIEKLSGKTDCNPVNSIERVTHILTFGVFSPVDIQVVETSTGKIVGKDFATGKIVNQIDGAFYSGYDTENEFITIPNPEDGEYQILTQGTGNGAYKIEATKISENEDGTASESTASVEGVAQESIIGEPIKVKVEDNEVVAEETKDTTPPTITIASPQNKEYKNNETMNIEYEVADNKSQEAVITKTVMLDDGIYNKNSVDLSLFKLGNHILQIKAIDEAGNEGKSEIAFVTKTDIDSTISNIKHYFDLGLIKKKSEKQNLLIALGVINQRLEFLEMVNQNPHISARAKGIILQIVHKQINMHLDFMIHHVEKMTRVYDPLAKELVLDALESLKI